MTSRSFYDLTGAVLAFNDNRDRSQDSHFAQTYFSLDRVQDPSEDHVQAESRSAQLPYPHGGLIPTGRDVLKFSSGLPLSFLCSDCTTMVNKQNIWQPTQTKTTERAAITYEKMLRSADEGCHICYLQVRVLKTHQIDQLRKVIYREYYFWQDTRFENSLQGLGRTAPTQGLSIQYFLKTSTVPQLLGDGRGTGLILAEAEDFHEEDAQGRYRISETVNAPQTWQCIRNWIKICESNHKTCQRLKMQDRRLPTRLLELSSGKPDRIRVVKSDILPPNTKYITLSHRWGNTEFHSFIRGCPPSYFDDIEITQLPQVFRDIVTVAQHLQIAYIWVDAFCIKQGSEDDWTRESARMGDVYRFSWCNIAASRAASSDESMFAVRNVLDVEPCILQMPWDSSITGFDKRWMAFEMDHFWERNVQDAPLAERAWVLQEIALASRVVYFGRTQLFWECSELRACETCPDGFPGVATKKLSLHTSCLQFKPTSAPTWDHQKYHIWSLLVTSYSACLLTETSKDKLVALSGLAKNIGRPHEYLAGLWKENLEYELLWRSNPANMRAPIAGPDYQAPSWSWASVNGNIHYRIREAVNDPDAELLARVIDSHTTLHGQDPTGRVIGGHITVSGPLAKASFGSHQIATAQYQVINGGLGRGFMDGSESSGGPDYYCCMPVEVKTKKGQSHTLVVGLILRPSNLHKGCFQRSAYFTVSDHEDRKNGGDTMNHFWNSFRDPDRKPSDDLARESRTPRTAAAIVYAMPIYDFTIV